MRGVFFRGDDRHPDEMFNSGMYKKNPLFLWVSLINGREGIPITRRSSAVCFSKDFYVAAMFPITRTKEVWVYFLDLDVSYVVNIQKSQFEAADKKSANNKSVYKDILGSPSAFRYMFAQERAANSVVMEDIIGALKIEREVMQQGKRYRFKCIEYISNDKYTGSSADLAEDSAKGLISANEWLWTPLEMDGFVKSNPSMSSHPYGI